ncbi:MAG: hypothetical protein MZV64_47525 [Ignavibacteriales bacterium]|nr:hypothetical protein [Ignavibacteriales bacterium]
MMMIKLSVSSNSETNINLNKSSFRLKILDSGKIIEFSTELADSIVKISLTPDEAKKLAQDFIQNLRDDIIFIDDSLQLKNSVNPNTFYFKETETIEKLERVDYTFTWETKTNNQINYTLKAQVTGDQVSNFSIQVIIPDEYKKSETDVYEIAATISFYFY